jgi:hypothetical protein
MGWQVLFGTVYTKKKKDIYTETHAWSSALGFSGQVVFLQPQQHVRGFFVFQQTNVLEV